MAENSAIEWTHHTFNPWLGCTKVGPGCDHCYAEARMDTRLHVVQWGAGQPRKRTSAANWKGPAKWNARAAAAGARERVFCSSLADVFDNEVSDVWRADLFTLIRNTPSLDWLLLTKRIGNAQRMIEQAMRDQGEPADEHAGWPWPNVWLGATIVNQAEADRDIPKLLATPARVRFLSMEPLLAPVDLGVIDIDGHSEIYPLKGTTSCEDGDGNPAPDLPRVDWVIVGGESQAGARPMHPDWARSLRDQCAAAGVPFFMKQMGGVRDKRGALEDLPDDLRIREFPHANP